MRKFLHVIVRPGGLGDTLLLAPALSRLRLEGGREILLAGYPERLAPLIEAGLADSAVSLDRWLAEGEAVLNERMGAASHPADDVKEAHLEGIRIDSFFPSLPKGISDFEIEASLHPPFPQEGKGIHVAAHLAESLGVRLPAIPEDPLANLVSKRAPASRPTLWIHPGAGSLDKRWPIASFLEVSARWQERTQSQASFLLGEADLDLQAPIEAAGFSSHRPRTPVELARLFCREDVFLGADSGPAHLAALMGLRTVAIFKHSDPILWSPWGSRSEVLIYEREGGCLELVDILARLLRLPPNYN